MRAASERDYYFTTQHSLTLADDVVNSTPPTSFLDFEHHPPSKIIHRPSLSREVYHSLSAFTKGVRYPIISLRSTSSIASEPDCTTWRLYSACSSLSFNFFCSPTTKLSENTTVAMISGLFLLFLSLDGLFHLLATGPATQALVVRRPATRTCIVANIKQATRP